MKLKKYQRTLLDGTVDTVLVSVELNATVAHSNNGNETLIPCEPRPLPFNLLPDYVPQDGDIPYVETETPGQ